jgi:hypothetical protein
MVRVVDRSPKSPAVRRRSKKGGKLLYEVSLGVGVLD